jgi:hypothetical protein
VAIFGIERGAERGLTRFAAVIFDMDGLLLDTERIAFETFVLACQHFELGDQAAVFYRCLGTNQARGHEVLREGLGGRVDPVTFGGVWESHYVAATSTRPVPLKPGVKQLLADLDQLGVPAAVATSTSSGTSPRWWAVTRSSIVSLTRPSTCELLTSLVSIRRDASRSRTRTTAFAPR